MKKWKVIVMVESGDEQTGGDILEEVTERLSGLETGDPRAAVCEEVPQFCYKHVPNPQGFPGSALCRLKPNHEGDCKWPWGG